MLRRTRAPAPSLCSIARKALRICRGEVIFGDVVRCFAGGEREMIAALGSILNEGDMLLESLLRDAVMKSLVGIARSRTMIDTKMALFMNGSRNADYL